VCDESQSAGGASDGADGGLYQDSAFTYMLPPGWTVPTGGEGPDNINLVDSSGGVVAYQFTSSQNLPFSSP
jgi:hypothetical protein